MLILALLLLMQQRSYPPAEIEAGRRMYQSLCESCHGTTGTAFPGLGATSDDDFVRMTRLGVAATSMPPYSLSDAEARALMAYLRTLSGGPDTNASVPEPLPSGDADRGRILFFGKGRCADCHTVKGKGNTSGPDLSAISEPHRGRTPLDLLRSVTEPDAEIQAEYRRVRVVPLHSEPVSGKLVYEDIHSLQLSIPGRGLISLAKSSLREFGPAPSPMPSFRDRLTTQELSDIVAYLVSLRD